MTARLLGYLITGWIALTHCGPLQAQQLSGGSAGTISIWRIAAALIVSLLVAVIAILALRRRGLGLGFRQGGQWPGLRAVLGANTARIQLVESRRIAAGAELCLVRCDAVEYLILVGAGEAKVLQGPAATIPQVEAGQQ